VNGADLTLLTAYLREVGRDEATAPQASAGNTGSGNGLLANYFNNTVLTGPSAATRVEAVNFAWGTRRPADGVNANYFSARWVGSVVPMQSGTYRFQTQSDDGVRLWVNDTLVVDHWTTHSLATEASPAINLSAGVPVNIKLEYFDAKGGATIRLRWRTPGNTAFMPISAAQLFAPPPN
jgi:hypothetical protein